GLCGCRRSDREQARLGLDEDLAGDEAFELGAHAADGGGEGGEDLLVGGAGDGRVGGCSKTAL
ncbi:hypothetical protein, partial [Longispora fulva]|uniref:hypothetical protein n=1 Tax=Longispora fulva TaxID=619741 RepID=UPI003641D7D2